MDDMSRLKIYMDWKGERDNPSEYCPNSNEIYVNPYYCGTYPSWAWLIPLVHEVMHWLINKLPCTKPKIVGLAPIWIFHLKLDTFHPWLMEKLFPEP